MKILLSSALLLFSSCSHTTKIQRPFSEAKEVSISNKDVLQSVNIYQMGSNTDKEHRARAKELGILYVDYLHMINSNKKSTTSSVPTFHH